MRTGIAEDEDVAYSKSFYPADHGKQALGNVLPPEFFPISRNERIPHRQVCRNDQTSECTTTRRYRFRIGHHFQQVEFKAVRFLLDLDRDVVLSMDNPQIVFESTIRYGLLLGSDIDSLSLQVEEQKLIQTFYVLSDRFADPILEALKDCRG